MDDPGDLSRARTVTDTARGDRPVDVVGYATDGELPVSVQRSAFDTWSEDHDVVEWIVDDPRDLWHRDGAEILLEHVLDGVTDVWVYQWQVVSPDPLAVLALQFFVDIRTDRELRLWNPDGRVDLSDHTDQNVAHAATVCDQISGFTSDWDRIVRRARRDTPPKGGATPYGLTTDCQRYDRPMVTEWLPDGDAFSEAIQVLNRFAHSDTTPYTDDPPTARQVADEIGINESPVYTIWKYRDTYRDVAEQHRDDLVLLDWD